MLALVLSTVVGNAAAPPSATQYYIAALRATRTAPSPKHATYHTGLVSTGMKIDVTSYKGTLAFALGYGSSMRPSAAFDSRYDASGVTALVDGKTATVLMPLFNPTWSGIAEWMRYGFYGPDQAAASATAEPSPTPTPADRALTTIMTVEAVNPGSYSITDGGASPCSNGASGHKLLLRALGNPQSHPLTSVVIDTQNTRFCSMDFRLGANSVMSFTGFFHLNLRDVDDYWLVTDGTADFLIRALGIRASNTHLVFANTNFVF